jgi:hypothetical protein
MPFYMCTGRNPADLLDNPPKFYGVQEILIIAIAVVAHIRDQFKRIF